MSMVLYIDETENDNYFIVTGLLVNSKQNVDMTYKRFKKKVNAMNLSPKRKERIFNEFKSVILDREFQRIKRSMLIEIMKLENQIIYSCYLKKDGVFNQDRKETQYIKLLNAIVASISDDIDIIFDAFNKQDFETKIIESIKINKNVISIQPRDSFDEAGIQFVDNLCSAIRHSLSDDKNEFYLLIKENVIRV